MSLPPNSEIGAEVLIARFEVVILNQVQAVSCAVAVEVIELRAVNHAVGRSKIDREALLVEPAAAVFDADGNRNLTGDETKVTLDGRVGLFSHLTS